MTVKFLHSGDTALVVEFGREVSRELNDRVLLLQAHLRAAKLAGVIETVPSFRSLLVHYDPLRTSAAALIRAIGGLLERDGELARPSKLWHVPVCYEGGYAPDLTYVAEQTRLAPAEIVALHSGTRYHIYMIGFVPGFPYMGDLPAPLRLPRRVDPRVRVPPGSVAMATELTAIYPLESTGGWHLIGTTPIRLFDNAAQPPALFAPGDSVRFEAINEKTFLHIRDDVKAGTYRVPCEILA